MNVKEYIDRYFEGDLSDVQEQELKDFLQTAESSEYDEIKAVLGFFSVGKAVSRTEGYSKKARPFRTLAARVAATAAAAALLVTIGVNTYNRNNVCIAYAHGQMITDKEVIMNDVENTLAELFESAGTDVDEQLNEFFGK